MSFKPASKSSSSKFLTLRNPHAVWAALNTRPQAVRKLLLPGGKAPSPAWGEVESLARKNRVIIESVAAGSGMEKRRDAFNDGRTGSSGEAVVDEKDGCTLDELFSNKPEDGYGTWLALDCLQDPHNVGAIFRTASFFGIQGILLTVERSAPLTGTVYDIAAGGVETLPYCQEVNLSRALQAAKDHDVWVLGTSEHEKSSLRNLKKDRHRLIVVGNEEKGMRRLTLEACDELCTIPSLGKDEGSVTSLNVSVATGILLSHFS
jgi:23S rRNA (guanosine2251-2'-O)-methyltransferase